jgi:hypothetical protein
VVDLHLCSALASLMVYVHHDFVFMKSTKQRGQTIQCLANYKLVAVNASSAS